MPNRTWASSLRPEPTSPARPTISPARTVRLTFRVIGRRTRSRASSTGAPIGTAVFGKKGFDATPDHHLDEFGRAGLRHRPRSDVGAVAQHRDAVGDLEQLVEPMADVDDPDAAAFELADDVEQARDVALGQRGGRLVHDQDARVVRQRAQNLDPLAVADGERADDLVGGEIVDLERGEQRLGLRAHGAPVDPAAARRAAHGRGRCSRRR